MDVPQASPAFSAGGGFNGGQGSTATGSNAVLTGDYRLVLQPAAGVGAAESNAAGATSVRARQWATLPAELSLFATDEFFREAGVAGGSVGAGMPLGFLV